MSLFIIFFFIFNFIQFCFWDLLYFIILIQYLLILNLVYFISIFVFEWRIFALLISPCVFWKWITIVNDLIFKANHLLLIFRDLLNIIFIYFFFLILNFQILNIILIDFWNQLLLWRNKMIELLIMINNNSLLITFHKFILNLPVAYFHWISLIILFFNFISCICSKGLCLLFIHFIFIWILIIRILFRCNLHTKMIFLLLNFINDCFWR